MQTQAYEQLYQGIRDAYASRYFIAAGAMVLFYDHLLTFPDECRFVWKAKTSFAKCAFLLNRYAVLSVMLLILPATCGFGAPLSDRQCQGIVLATALTAIVSMGIGNALVLLRVLVLWQDDKKVTRILWGGYLSSVAVMTSMMLLTCAKAIPQVKWSKEANTCAPGMKFPSLPATYGAPLFFEVMIIGLVSYHSLSTPRTSEMPLAGSLRQNGLAFFITVFVLRLVNMFAAIIVRPGLVFLTLFFVGASLTINLNHSILRLRRADVKQYLLARDSVAERAASPFGLYRRGRPGPDFDEDVLDEFDDIKTKVSGLRMHSLENPCRKPREITIYLGGTRPDLPSYHQPLRPPPAWMV